MSVLRDLLQMGRRRIAIGSVALLLPLTIAATIALSLSGGSRAAPVGGFVVDQTAVSECREIAAANRDPIPCYGQAIGNIAAAEGPRVALTRFVEEMRAVPLLNASCHPVSHRIGAAGLLHAGGDVGLAFVGGDSSCASGYYHGVIEDALGTLAGRPDELWGRAERLCLSPAVQESPYLADQCYHGLGHGLMLSTDYNLPSAFEVCTRFDEPRAASGCYTGAFMENFARFAANDLSERSPWVNDSDLGSTCAGLRGRWQDDAASSCYAALAYRIWSRSNGLAPWAEYIDLCRSIDEKHRAPCYNGFGRQVYTLYAGAFERSIVEMRDACLLSPPDGISPCVSSIASHVTYTDSNGVRASRFCDVFEGKPRSDCFSGIGNLLASFRAEEATLEERCKELMIRDEDLPSCMRAELY